MSDPKFDAQKDREARLNEALRANLRKRKQQSQARKVPPTDVARDADETGDSSKNDAD